MIGTNKYKRPAVLIFIFDKVERQVHIGGINRFFEYRYLYIDFYVATLQFYCNV